MSQKEAILYAHGSAYNHGCEAIVRSTCNLLSLDKKKSILYSNNIEGDLKYHIDELLTLLPVNETPVDHNSPLGYIYRLRSHLHTDHEHMYYRYFGKRQYKYMYDFGEVALSIGGDNYCYPSAINGLEVRNYWLNRKGFKTILWGASLTEEFMTPNIVEDMNRYSLIVVREHLSYELLQNKGVKTNVICAPDPAFSLLVEDVPWPDGKKHSNVIGINISPFVLELSQTENMGITNYVNLIKWIIDNTNCEIALIPHVIFPNDNNSDIAIANLMLKNLPETDRIFTIPDGYNCSQLKSLISKCRFFIGARTHSTIAAYSTGVPTLVVGYSVKSIGIAQDLFGDTTDFVVSVQDMSDEDMLTMAFCRLFSRENEIRRILNQRIPEYLLGYSNAVSAVKDILETE